MARGFVTGVLWGCIVVGAGLTVLSQMAPPSKQSAVVADTDDAAAAVALKAAADKVAAEKAAADKLAADRALAKAASEKASADKVAAEKAASDKAAAEEAAMDKAKADQLAAENLAADKVAADNAAAVAAAASPKVGPVAPAQVATAAPVVPDAVSVAPAAPADLPDDPAKVDTAPVQPASDVVPPVIAPAVGPKPDAPVQDAGGVLAVPVPLAPLADLPAVPEAPPTLAGLEPALTAPGAEAAPTAPLPPEPEGAKDALLAPALQPGLADTARLPQIAPADDPGLAPAVPVAVPAPAAELPPKESPAKTLEAQVPTLPPVKSLTDKVPKGLSQAPDVEVNTLPQIGGTVTVTAPVDEVRPVVEYARQFDGAAGKPLFVILLHDVGSAGMSRAELTKLPFPASFVVDPLATDAKEASAAYRAAGQEVVMLANGIPEGAEASDLAETFQTLAGILPESVAVIDQDLGGFQDNRPLAGLVLPILQDEGRGLVTYDRGLNAADQIARRDGVPAAVIFRRLDGEGENKATIRRYLDRAAFRAAQEGAVVVIGDTRADTVAAILEWTVEGRASSVTLAPLTAVMGR